MRTSTLLGVLTLLVGTSTWLAVGDESTTGDVYGEIRFSHAEAHGTLSIAAGDGALLAEGPSRVTFHAASMRVVLVTVRKEYVANPIGGDVFVSSGAHETSFEFANATLVSTSEDERALAFIHASPTWPAATISLPLGRVDGDPFALSRVAHSVAVGTLGQRWAFEEAVLPPTFGVAHASSSDLFVSSLSSARATGGLELVLDFTNVEVAASGKTDSFTTGTQRVDEERVGKLPLHYEIVRSYARVDAADGTLSADLVRSHVWLATHAPEYVFEGTLGLDHARGSARYGTANASFHDARVELVGRIDITLAASATSRYPTDLSTLAYEPSATLAGSASEVRVDDVLLSRGATPEARAVSLVAFLLAFALAAWQVGSRALASLVPLYARLTSRTLLANACRRSIFELIEAQPLTHHREIMRLTGFGFGTVAYHLSVLRHGHLITRVRVPGRELFFVPTREFPPRVMGQMSALADPTRRRIACAILARGSATQGALARELGMHQGSLSRQLARLSRAGLIDVEGVRNKQYRVTPLAAAWLARAQAREARHVASMPP